MKTQNLDSIKKRWFPLSTQNFQLPDIFMSPFSLNQKTQESPYPGDGADAKAILGLAEAYHAAAKALLELAKRGEPLSYAPARLSSIHAIELCLNAFLRSRGVKNSQIRARTHNLADDSFVEILRLRKKTADHLVAMTRKREYLISRYAPESSDQHTELNRLVATLDEVMSKVARHFRLGA